MKIDQVTQAIINRTRQWLSIRVRLSASKGKQKESTSGVPQSMGYKEYARKTRSSSRKNTSTDLDETVGPKDITNDLMTKLHVKMRI